MKADSWEFVFSEKCDVVRVKDSLLFELPRLLVRSDRVARNRLVSQLEREVNWAFAIGHAHVVDDTVESDRFAIVPAVGILGERMAKKRA